MHIRFALVVVAAASGGGALGGSSRELPPPPHVPHPGLREGLHPCTERGAGVGAFCTLSGLGSQQQDGAQVGGQGAIRSYGFASRGSYVEHMWRSICGASVLPVRSGINTPI